ncbi:MAG: electron transfer flavoprotein subunit beta, partial [Dehalococcoidia bacterium]|nr:electron transfer flavoprotein subunit beta [Dehalococcoidia bacterium]
AAKEITVWNLSDLGLEREAVGAPGSPTQVPRVFPPAPRQQAEILTGLPSVAVDALVARLRELRAIQ